VVAVLPQLDRLLGATGPKIHGQHRLDVGFTAPPDELVQPELVALHTPPGGVESGRAVFGGTHAVLPAVAGHEVAAWITNDADPELTDEVEDVGPEAVLVRQRVARLVQAGVDTPAHVLDEAAEQPPIHGPYGETRFEHDRSGEHVVTTFQGHDQSGMSVTPGDLGMVSTAAVNPFRRHGPGHGLR
jgi:hypothetical protein